MVRITEINFLLNDAAAEPTDGFKSLYWMLNLTPHSTLVLKWGVNTTSKLKCVVSFG